MITKSEACASTSTWLVPFHACLAKGAYESAVELLHASRLTAADLQDVITQYGRKVVEPQSIEIDAVAIEGSVGTHWSIYTPIWTSEEGRSDLTLDLTVDLGGNGIRVTLNDLHVL